MLISVFLVWETTLIKFKSSFFPKARNNLPIIDRIIEDTRFYLAFFDFFPKFEQKKFQTAAVFSSEVQNSRSFWRPNLLVLTSETHSRQTRYAKFNIACPRVNRNTEGGRTFTVTASLEWNKLLLQMRKAETLKTFKNSLWNRIFKDQQSLNHFSI